mgnify:CR=1 FL=1
MKKTLFSIALAALTFVSAAMPRAEYPRPQFERGDWQNLNGEWTYELDLVQTGHERGLTQSTGFDGKITVPFAPESELSGVQHKDFIPSIWYQREISIPQEWAGKDVLLNGEQALAFARERHLFASGDFARQEHQQQVIKAIMQKIMRTRDVNTFLNVLDAAGNNIQTNFTVAQMTNFFRVALQKANRYYDSEHVENIFDKINNLFFFKIVF